MPSPVTFYNQFLTQKNILHDRSQETKAVLSFCLLGSVAFPKFGIISEEVDLGNIYALKFSEWKRDIGHYLILVICMRIP